MDDVGCSGTENEGALTFNTLSFPPNAYSTQGNLEPVASSRRWGNTSRGMVDGLCFQGNK